MRWIAAIIAIVMGVGLIVTPIASSLFSRTKDAQRLADDVRPAMTKKALAVAETDKNTVKAAIREFNGPTFKLVAGAFGMTPRQFAAYLQRRYPDVAAGSRVLPVGVAHGEAILRVLERNRTNFESADSYPVEGMSVRVGPWIFVALGVAFAVLGVIALRVPGRWPLAVLAVAGLVPVVFALAAALPSKASDTRDLSSGLKSTLSAQSANAAVFQVHTAERFVAQVNSGLLPALGRQLHMTPAQLNAFLARKSPALSRALPQFNRILAEYDPLAVALVNDRPHYVETAKLKFVTLTWILIGASAMVFLVSGVALLAGARGRAAAPLAAPRPAV